MTQQQATLAVAFIDVRGSTGLYERLGDRRARDLTADALDVFCKGVRARNGTVIKLLGDGAMVTLPSAEAALLASIASQEVQVRKQVGVGIGIQFGSVLQENGDVFGDAVNVAARLCSLAKAGEILTTADTVRHLPAMLRALTRHIDTAEVKGRREPVEIHQVLWGEANDDATTTMLSTASPMATSRRPRGITLTLGGNTARIQIGAKPLTLGRTQGDLVVPDSLVSRHHATLEAARGKFFMTDASTNGTFLLFDHGAHTVLRRESGELTDSGWIGLGRPPTADNPYRIRFVVEPGDE